MQKSIYLSVISFFLLIAVISGTMIYAHFKEANTQNELYESLAEIVEEDTETETTAPSKGT